MKKFVIKTAVITLISLFAAAMLFFIGVTVCSPRAMSDFFYDVGNETLSAWYTELSYQKTDSATDLKKLVYRSEEAKDYTRLEKYCKIMTERADFSEICAAENGYKNYVLGKQVIAMYVNGKSAAEIFAVADNSLDGGYTDDNAYRSLLYGAGIFDDAEICAELKNKFLEMSYEDNSLFEEDKKYLQDLT